MPSAPPIKGRKVGSFGDLACFSFDGIKNITSGEGGAVVTSDHEVIQSVQDARLLGVQRDTEKRYQGAPEFGSSTSNIKAIGII